MIRNIIFFYIFTTAFGRVILRDRRITPIDRIAHTRRAIPKDDLNILGHEPAFRTDEFVKLPKEIFDKWFAKNQQELTPSDISLNDNLPQPIDVTTEYSEPFNVLVNNTDDKTIFEAAPDAKEDLIKKVDAHRNIQDLSPYNAQHNNYQENTEAAVKQKLLQLIRKTKSSIEKKIEPIQAVHDAYKLNKIYKIGYLVSNINRTQDNLKEFYNHIETNAKYWNGMKVLNAYDQVKTADEFLSKALYILNVVGAMSSFTRVLSANPYSTTASTNDGDVTDRVAWSYYDDSM